MGPVEIALSRPPPFDMDTPLPSDIKESLNLLNSPRGGGLLNSRGERLDIVEMMARELRPVSELWYSKTHSVIDRSTDVVMYLLCRR